ncbi:MAG: aminopeptidase P family N-terminal domain-containing protein, partial [Geopsychrobacter sp.]|nr:aminopeptidase P family N-terminal domain-containing protein [Geopsychrobacter sp.]
MSNSPKLARIATFQYELQTKNIDAAILVLSRDIFYYTGTAQPSILVVTPDSFFLIVRRALDFVERETWLPVDKLIPGGSFREAAESLKNLVVRSV